MCIEAGSRLALNFVLFDLPPRAEFPSCHAFAQVEQPK
jgi:hypothetical protein